MSILDFVEESVLKVPNVHSIAIFLDFFFGNYFISVRNTGPS